MSGALVGQAMTEASLSDPPRLSSLGLISDLGDKASSPRTDTRITSAFS